MRRRISPDSNSNPHRIQAGLASGTGTPSENTDDPPGWGHSRAGYQDLFVCSSLRKLLSPNHCGRPVLYKQAGICCVPHLRWPPRAVRGAGGASGLGSFPQGAAEPAPTGPGWQNCSVRDLGPVPGWQNCSMRDLGPVPGWRGRFPLPPVRAQCGPVSSAAAPPGGAPELRRGFPREDPGTPHSSSGTAGACWINTKIFTNSLPTAS